MDKPTYWTEEDLKDTEKATTFTDLLKIAKRILERMDNLCMPIAMVSGPISTGGKGSITENLKELKHCIEKLKQSTTFRVFDQLAFQNHIYRIKHSPLYKGSNRKLLNQFFLSILISGRIRALYFLPDWESSEGCRYEHQHALELGIKIIYLDRITTFKEFQKWVDEDWKERSGGVPNLEKTIAKFNEEHHEVIAAVASIFTTITEEKDKNVNLMLEIGDVIIMLATLATYFDINLEDAINKAKRKIEKRHADKKSSYISFEDWDKIGPEVSKAMIEIEKATKKK